MTNAERIAMINGKRDRVAEQEAKKAQETALLSDELEMKIYRLRERIENVIHVCNALRLNEFLYNIRIGYDDRRLRKYGYDGGICADGFHHHVGVYGNRRYPSDQIEWIGFKAGGACGYWDFYTDGVMVADVHEETGKRQRASVKHMEKFLEEFPKYESALYAWVDENMN